jgi:uncharacterized protein
MTTQTATHKGRELLLGLVFGLAFGFFLQKGGVTHYDVIVGQLLLEDFTVLKIMLAAVIVGMPGVYAIKHLGRAELQPKSGSLGINVIGGLLFGVGFAVLGYCPGTLAGAVGNGYLDALVGGLAGIIIGSDLYAQIYPRVRGGIQRWGYFGDLTLPRWLKVNDWLVVIPAMILLTMVLVWLEVAGL